MSSDINILFKLIKEDNPYPNSMLKICGELKRVAFFPGGKGTIDNSEDLSNRKIMILGQDFDCEANYKKAIEIGYEDINRNPTWRKILNILEASKIPPEECFFTNAILGIRKGDNGIGKSPAFLDNRFLNYCREIFIKQVEIQKPKLIIVLGKYTAIFLAPLHKQLNPWMNFKNFQNIDDNNLQVVKDVPLGNISNINLVLLTHPSLRHLNIKKRKFNNFSGNEAELEMIKEGLKY